MQKILVISRFWSALVENEPFLQPLPLFPRAYVFFPCVSTTRPCVYKVLSSGQTNSALGLSHKLKKKERCMKNIPEDNLTGFKMRWSWTNPEKKSNHRHRHRQQQQQQHEAPPIKKKSWSKKKEWFLPNTSLFPGAESHLWRHIVTSRTWSEPIETHIDSWLQIRSNSSLQLLTDNDKIRK